MPHRLSIALLALLVAVAAAPPAAASPPCEGGEAVCATMRKVAWCGGDKTATCPEGELCTADVGAGDGAACVPVEELDCNAIGSSEQSVGPQGTCTEEGAAVWCDDGVRIRHCGAEAVCAFAAEAGHRDCLPAQPRGSPDGRGPDAVPPRADAGADGSRADAGFGADARGTSGPEDGDPSRDVDAGDAAGADQRAHEAGGVPRADTGPTPRVGDGGVHPSLGDEAGAPGCRGGGSAGSTALAVLLSALALTGRRRRGG